VAGHHLRKGGAGHTHLEEWRLHFEEDDVGRLFSGEYCGGKNAERVLRRECGFCARLAADVVEARPLFLDAELPELNRQSLIRINILPNLDRVIHFVLAASSTQQAEWWDSISGANRQMEQVEQDQQPLLI
jgi:hypothetical protein